MSRAAVYLVNEASSYLKMCLNSVEMLRNHNRHLAVHAILVKDHHATSPDHVRIFRDRCADLNVAVHDRIPIHVDGEENFFHINRKYLADIPEDDILYIDSDTFIFGDVGQLLDNHAKVDFAACEAKWSYHQGYRREFVAPDVGPFSSGVMIWNHGTIREWCHLIPAYFAEFRSNRTPLAHWLHQVHPDCTLREEFSVTQHVARANLTSEFLLPGECHLIAGLACIDHLGSATIFHSYAANWRRAYNCLRRGGTKKISPAPLRNDSHRHASTFPPPQPK